MFICQLKVDGARGMYCGEEKHIQGLREETRRKGTN